MSARPRKHFSGPFTAKVALKAIRAVKTVNESAQEYGVHPTQVGQWKKELPEQAADLFDAKRGPKPADPSASSERLCSEIGRLTMELDWLKKSRGYACRRAAGWVSPHEPLTLSRQCDLAGVTRSTIYARHPAATPGEQELILRGLIDADYTRHPCYGSRTIRQYLARGRAPDQPQTGVTTDGPPGSGGPGAGAEHESPPSAAQSVSVSAQRRGGDTAQSGVEHRHHLPPLGAWLCVPGGRDRLVLAQRAGMAIIEYTRERVPCGGSGAGTAALRHPETFNTDQGCQFTSETFTGVLTAHGIAISRDGRGRALDNIVVERLWRSVQYEDVSLRGYTPLSE